MKKQLLAMAIGAAVAAPGAALAEAELYGQFDVTLQKSESIGEAGSQDPTVNSQNTVNFLNGEIGPRYAMGSAVGDHWELRNNKSRLGVRGSADLDSVGNSAIYQLEMQFEPGLDANTPQFALRNTFVGVNSDDYGKVFVGRYDSIVKQAEFSVDQFNNTDADIEQISALQNRYSDTVNYHSPKFGPSLQVKVQVAPGESEVYVDTDGDVDRETSMVDGYGISLGMEEGNMFGAIAYETAMMQSTNPAAVTTEVDALRISGGLDGQDFGVGFLWEQIDGDNNSDTFGPNSDDSRSGWIISGRFNPTEKLALKAQYGDSDTYIFASQVDGSIAPPGDTDINEVDGSLKTATIGADYMLGKTTKVYTFYSMNAADGFTNDDSEFNVLAFGLQHKF